jgi:hypothetical protein
MMSVFLLAIHIPVVAALAIVITGGLNITSTDPSKASNAVSLYKAGVMLFFVIYLVVAATILYLVLTGWRKLPVYNERRLGMALLASIPFLFVKYIYSVLTAYVNNSTFRFYGGAVGPFAGMSVVMEFFIAGFFVVAGVMSRHTKLNDDGSHAEMRQKRSVNGV